MLLPKGGVNWKAARSRLPPTRVIWIFLTRTRFLLCVALAGIVLLLWRGVSSSARDMQRSVVSTCPVAELTTTMARTFFLTLFLQILLLGTIETAYRDDTQ